MFDDSRGGIRELSKEFTKPSFIQNVWSTSLKGPSKLWDWPWDRKTKTMSRSWPRTILAPSALTSETRAPEIHRYRDVQLVKTTTPIS